MPVEQYVYFAIGSEELSPDQLTLLTGLAADATRRRGSLASDPPHPALNIWRLESHGAGLGIDEMINDVLTRALPHRARIRSLVRAPDNDVVAWLQVVRRADGGGEPQEPAGELLWQSGGQDPVGWRLDRELLEFLDDVGAELDADEYD